MKNVKKVFASFIVCFSLVSQYADASEDRHTVHSLSLTEGCKVLLKLVSPASINKWNTTFKALIEQNQHDYANYRSGQIQARRFSLLMFIPITTGLLAYRYDNIATEMGWNSDESTCKDRKQKLWLATIVGGAIGMYGLYCSDVKTRPFVQKYNAAWWAHVASLVKK